MPDHPRSRGVYEKVLHYYFLSTGSSPLARGLPEFLTPRNVVVRIIPARAGFTCVEGVADASLTDHPRSRGVYLCPTAHHSPSYGSSPLARGLLMRSSTCISPSRIIPARAGFTALCCCVVGKCVGSSPLARGLRRIVLTRNKGHGIIPARAGFTRISFPSSLHSQDHPRSRGVYKTVDYISKQIRGSSPLARGLHAAFAFRRIFVPDHPRSRGVYVQPRTEKVKGTGSSPLARGLHPPPLGGHALRRIIPARAGFTFSGPSVTWALRDHPRSRGVYLCAAPFLTRTGGSSPLARGLRVRCRLWVRCRRIIPARAGFTSRWRRPGRSRWDHPRSRGVYWDH